MPSPSDTLPYEKRSMQAAMAVNLLMAAAGVAAGLVAHSGALILDGLFSLIGFVSALFGLLVAKRLPRPPDQRRPLGYATEEVVFASFRALTVAWLVLASLWGALEKIYIYLRTGQYTPLDFSIILVYSLSMVALCFGLWLYHRYNWRKTGRRSEILRMEAHATTIDGAITAATGLGFGLIYFFGQSWLAPVAPVGDSLILILLCLYFSKGVVQAVRSSFAELLNSSATPAVVQKVRRIVHHTARQQGVEAWNISVVKHGRVYLVQCALDPRAPVTAADFSRLRQGFQQALADELPGVRLWLHLAEKPPRP